MCKVGRCGEGAVEHVRVGSDVFLFTDISIDCVRAPASFSLGGNRSGGLGGRHWEGCWAGLGWAGLGSLVSVILSSPVLFYELLGGLSASPMPLVYILVRRRDLINVMEADLRLGLKSLVQSRHP